KKSINGQWLLSILRKPPRSHPVQNDDFMPPIEAILAPLEAELKLA
ncbi:unnamed protein product, partial [Brassica oleracea var. botrytis]